MDFSRWSETPQQQQQQQQHDPTNPLHSDPSYGQLYNAPQQTHHPQSYTPYPYYPSNPNPNPSDPHPQFDSTGPDTGLRPPGVDPYAPNPYAPHAGYEGPGAAASYGYQQQQMQPEVAAAYFHNPNAQQQNWGATDPVGYGAAVVHPIGMEQMVGADPNPMVWNNQRVHPFARGMTMKRLKKTKVVQSAWCELCKIDCNSQDILNTHRAGKKHMKNLKKLEESKNAVATATVTTTEPEDRTTVKEISSGESAKGKKMRRKQILASKPGEDLETKRQKLMECGTAVDSLRVCTVCSVVCNSETVFNLHLAGQKHAAKVADNPDGMQPTVGPNPNPNPVICNDQANLPSVNGTGKKKKNKNKKTQVVQSVRCELCKVDCSSQDVFNKHELGRRHKKNLEKLEESKNAAAAAAAAAAAVKLMNPAGTNESPAVEKAKTAGGKTKRKKGAIVSHTGEELETKKRKLLECGTSADSVKACEVCNVVCNSEMVYKYHLAGQKHAAQMKKQTSAIVKSAIGPQAYTAAAATSAVGPQAVIAATVPSDVSPQLVKAATTTSDVSPQLVTPATASPAIGAQLVTSATATSTVSPQPVTAS